MWSSLPPRVAEKPVPVFTCDELARLEQACAGRSFTQRRDAAIIAVLRAAGIRPSELAGPCHDPGDPRHDDVDLWHREITVTGKGRKTRTVKITTDAARALDRYLRARARHPQAHRPQLWLGAGNRGPMTSSGLYQAITRRGRQAGVEVTPHRFRHHFSHAWLDRGGAEGDLMELNGWSSPRCSAATAPAPAPPGHAATTTTSWTTCPDPTRSPPKLPRSPAHRMHAPGPPQKAPEPARQPNAKPPSLRAAKRPPTGSDWDPHRGPPIVKASPGVTARRLGSL
jgi:hypothetical protein